MLLSVHTVLIGKACPASYTDIDSMTAGDVALFDENRKLIATAAAAVDAKSLFVGVKQGTVNVTMPDGTVEEQPNIEFSTEIQKAAHPSAVIGEYTAPTKQKVTITLTGATIVAGNRYVVRIVYRDLSDYKFQFTHTYEVYATSATASDLASAIAAEINKHKNRRVTASAAAAVVTLEAMDRTDNEGVYSLNEYAIVEMDVFLYTTIPGALLSNQPESVPGAVVAVATKATPGKGYWKQVRDAEYRNMGYKGIVYTDAYPVIEQERKVVKDAEYDYAIIECDNLYLSNDNQYIKTTPLTVEVYCPSLKDSIVDKGIQSFIKGETVA